jgi:hypothetical protein
MPRKSVLRSGIWKAEAEAQVGSRKGADAPRGPSRPVTRTAPASSPLPSGEGARRVGEGSCGAKGQDSSAASTALRSHSSGRNMKCCSRLPLTAYRLTRCIPRLALRASFAVRSDILSPQSGSPGGEPCQSKPFANSTSLRLRQLGVFAAIRLRTCVMWVGWNSCTFEPQLLGLRWQ